MGPEADARATGDTAEAFARGGREPAQLALEVRDAPPRPLKQRPRGAR